MKTRPGFSLQRCSIVLLCFLVLPALTGTTIARGDDAEAVRTIVLTGKVVDQGEKPVAGALVSAAVLDDKALAAFLLKHKLATRDAEAMLAEGPAKARAEKKRVYFIVSASWCGPCRMLTRYLSSNKKSLDAHYVFTKLDISRDTNADALCELYQGKNTGNGVPWYAILDDDGKALITSNAKDLETDYGSTNIGFPSEKAGIDHFLKMLKLTTPGLTAETLATLRQGLEKKP